MKQMKQYTYHYGLNMRAYLSNKQKHIVFENSRAKDYVYNKCVAIDNELFWLRKVKTYCKPVSDRIDYLETVRNDVSEIRNTAPFLYGDDIAIDALYNAIANYHKAWDNYKKVKGTSVPTFHKRTETYSFQTNPHYDKNGRIGGSYFIDETHVMIPKVGRVRVKGDKEYIHHVLANTERIGTFTITLNSDGSCYISAQLASDTPYKEKYKPTGKAVGIDVNIKNLYADSDGNIVDNPKYLKQSEKKLVKEQRKLSNKLEAAKKDCPKDMKLRSFLFTRKEYQEQRRKVAHIHSHVANQRMGYLHCETKQLVKNHDTIVSEDLKVRNMKENHCLAKSISDVSWGTLYVMLAIEAKQRGRIYIKVPPQYTTQTCSVCGCVMTGDDKLDLSVREWTCPHCGTRHNRDVNSAINILNRGLAMLKEGNC